MKFRLPADEHAAIMERIKSCSGLSQGYVAMLLLSAIICSFGILANSTATVIGAATIAPLTDPILGIALGFVRGDTKGFRRSLTAELSGIAICIVSGAMLALMFGPERIDFTQSEIMINIRPTLLDLAIGFCAGLAAAYASVNPRIGHSVAGVAIAISLVPPLCVSGICFGGGLAGQGTFREAGGGFLLFFANFVAIELAAGLLFTLVGLSRWKSLRQDKQLWRAFVINLLLLGTTAWFLQQQLSIMMRERMADKVIRRVVMAELGKLSGVRLDSLRLRFEKEKLRVELLTRSPEELSVGFAKYLSEKITEEIGQPIELSIGTALSSYITPTGRLFVPVPGAPKPEEVLRANTEWALQQAMGSFSQVELISFRELEPLDGVRRLFVSVRSPYLIDEELVTRLQDQCRQFLASRMEEPVELSLVVRTTLTQDYTPHGRVATSVDTYATRAERRRLEIEQRAASRLREEVSLVPGAVLLETRANLVSTDLEGGEQLDVLVTVQSATLLPQEAIQEWRTGLEEELGLPTHLELSNLLGRKVDLPVEIPTPVPAAAPTPVLVP